MIYDLIGYAINILGKEKFTLISIYLLCFILYTLIINFSKLVYGRKFDPEQFALNYISFTAGVMAILSIVDDQLFKYAMGDMATKILVGLSLINSSLRPITSKRQTDPAVGERLSRGTPV